MTKETVFSIIRALLSAGGAFLLGKNLLGHNVDEVLWQEIVGALLGLGSIIWGVVDKTATIEMLQSGVRNFLVFAGGFLTGGGVIKEQTMTAITGAIVAVLPLLQSKLSKDKNIAVATGRLGVADLNGVKRVAEGGEPMKPRITTPTETKKETSSQKQ